MHRREFENFFGTSTIPTTPGFLAIYGLDPAVYGGFLVSTQRHLGTTVRLDGLEFNYQRALTLLPPWARGLNEFANASTPHTTGASRDQFQSSPSLLNGGLSLTWRNYRLRVAANHRERQFQNTFTGRGIQPRTKNFVKARTYIDITGELVIGRELRLFAELRNVTDEGVDIAIYGPLTPPQARFQQRARSSSLWTFGVKETFQIHRASPSETPILQQAPPHSDLGLERKKLIAGCSPAFLPTPFLKYEKPRFRYEPFPAPSSRI